MRIYLAGPIFFYGDYLRNIEWATKIRERFPNCYVYSPVENTDINGVEGKISKLIKSKSSKTEYKLLSTEENKLWNKLLIVSVITWTIFKPWRFQNITSQIMQLKLE